MGEECGGRRGVNKRSKAVARTDPQNRALQRGFHLFLLMGVVWSHQTDTEAKAGRSTEVATLRLVLICHPPRGLWNVL